jgi:site-specific DNA-cytosine methylase
MTTIHQAISDIPMNAPDHNPESLRRFEVPKPPLDPHTLSGTVKTSGNASNVHHPSGLRGYTARELARLQTFAMYFRFLGNMTAQRKQIGNAFPPAAAQILFAGIKRFLEAVDREVMGEVEEI